MVYTVQWWTAIDFNAIDFWQFEHCNFKFSLKLIFQHCSNFLIGCILTNVNRGGHCSNDILLFEFCRNDYFLQWWYAMSPVLLKHVVMIMICGKPNFVFCRNDYFLRSAKALLAWEVTFCKMTAAPAFQLQLEIIVHCSSVLSCTINTCTKHGLIHCVSFNFNPVFRITALLILRCYVHLYWLPWDAL